MTDTINIFAAAPAIIGGWQRAGNELSAASNFDPILTELVKLRVSQINGCANCVNLHVAEARDLGEKQQRIDLLPTWRDAPCYTDRERAALAWAEVLTRLSEHPDRTSAFESLKAHFSEEEMVKLTTSINIISGWNRIAVGFNLFADVATIKASAAGAA